jgi:hypothetical protein
LIINYAEKESKSRRSENVPNVWFVFVVVFDMGDSFLNFVEGSLTDFF